ncbi:poly-A polymerase [Leptospira sp. 96542]|nr:poly-A polymerase [Leptospira sp. 96542]
MPVIISQIPKPFLSHLLHLNSTLKNAGFESYLVGGSVRDLVMGKNPNEYDLTTNAKPMEVKKLFRTVIDTGIDHGTVTVVLDKINYEITTYRIDKDYVDGRRPTTVEFGNSLSEDLKRRDFTMNALALDLDSETIVDEHNGMRDIQNKIIQTIGDPIQRFTEDGLRPIRALRFASTLGFEIEPNTRQAIKQTKEVTKKVSLERFQDEILKSFKGQKPSVMLSLLLDERYFSLFLPNLNPNPNPNLELLNHLDSSPKDLVGLQLAFMFSIVCPNSDPKSLEGTLRSFKFSGQMTKDCLFFTSLLKNWNQISNSHEIQTKEVKKFILAPMKKHWASRFPDLTILLQKLTQIFGTKTKEFCETILADHPLVLSDLAIGGNDLENLFPNVEKTKYGIILQNLMEIVWESPKENEIQKLFTHTAEIINNLV